jgi:hypothetical protein
MALVKQNITYGFLIAWDLSNMISTGNGSPGPFTCGGILLGLDFLKTLDLPFNVNFVWADTFGTNQGGLESVIKLVSDYKVDIVIGTELTDPNFISFITKIYNIPFLPIDTSAPLETESNDYVIYRLWSLYTNYANIIPLLFKHYNWKNVNIIYSNFASIIATTSQLTAQNCEANNIKVHIYTNYISDISLQNNGVRIFIIPADYNTVTAILYEAIAKNMIDGYVYILFTTRNYVKEALITDPLLIEASKSLLYISNNGTYNSTTLDDFESKLPNAQQNFYDNFVPPINGTIQNIQKNPNINLTHYTTGNYKITESSSRLLHTANFHDAILFSANLHKIAYESNSLDFTSINSWNKFGKYVKFDGISGNNIQLKNNSVIRDFNALILSTNSNTSDIYYSASSQKIIENSPIIWSSGVSDIPQDYISNSNENIPFWIYCIYIFLGISMGFCFLLGKKLPLKFKKYTSKPPKNINFDSTNIKSLPLSESNSKKKALPEIINNSAHEPILNNNNIIEFNNNIDSKYPNTYIGKWGNMNVVFKYLKGKQHILETELNPYLNINEPSDRILPYIGLINLNNNIFIATEYMSNGSVDKYIKNNPNLSYYTKLIFIYQLIEGINYLHNNNIIHGDIAARNLLLSSTLDILICDFGMSNNLSNNQSNNQSNNNQLNNLSNNNQSNNNQSNNLSNNIIGPIRWMSPELLNNDVELNKSTDIYACGMTIYEIFSEKIPWDNKNDTEVITEVLINKSKLNLDNIPESIKNIIIMCTYYNPKKRIKISELLKNIKKMIK